MPHATSSLPALAAPPDADVDESVIDAEFTPTEPADRSEVSGQTSEVRAEPDLTSDLRPLISEFTPEQDRDHAWLVDAVKGPVRKRVLTALAAAAGRLNVTELARRVGVPQDRVSHHLGILKSKGLVHDHQAGRFIEYECAPGLVRLEQREDGRLSLTLSRGNGVEVTLTAPGVAKAPVASDGAPMNTDKT